LRCRAFGLEQITRRACRFDAAFALVAELDDARQRERCLCGLGARQPAGAGDVLYLRTQLPRGTQCRRGCPRFLCTQSKHETLQLRVARERLLQRCSQGERRIRRSRLLCCCRDGNRAQHEDSCRTTDETEHDFLR
jgi:hypothetical protein